MSISAKTTTTPEKPQKNNHLMKVKRILNIKMSAKGGTVFIFSLPGRATLPDKLNVKNGPTWLAFRCLVFFWFSVDCCFLAFSEVFSGDSGF